jgi:hypothetical protein
LEVVLMDFQFAMLGHASSFIIDVSKIHFTWTFTVALSLLSLSLLLRKCLRSDRDNYKNTKNSQFQ